MAKLTPIHSWFLQTLPSALPVSAIVSQRWNLFNSENWPFSSIRGHSCFFCLLICTCLIFHLLSSFILLDTHKSSIHSTPANLEDGNTAYTLPANSTVKLPDFCKISSIFNNNHCFIVYAQPLWLQYSFPQFLPPFQTIQQPTNTKLSA